MSLGLLILGLVLFVLLVVLHEFGHFIVAGRNGVHSEEFGIFFPPRLWSRKTKNGVTFSINLLPLGGFVRLKGEHDSAKGPHTYGNASLYVKAKILLAGIAMNVVTAFVLLMILALVGMPQLINNQFTVKKDSHTIEQSTSYVTVNSVEPNSPASSIGLKSGDTLISFGTTGHTVQITNGDQLAQLGKQYAGQKVTLVYKKSNQQFKTQVTLRSAKTIQLAASHHHQEGYLGILDDTNQKGITLERSTWSAPIVAGGIVVQYTGLTFQAVGHAIRGLASTIAGGVTHNKSARENGQTQATKQLAGPYEIFEILKNGSILGYQFVLMIVAIISLSLAIVNLLPIPALDGGKLLMTAIFRLLKKPLTEQTEVLAYGTSFLLLLILMVLITVAEVRNN